MKKYIVAIAMFMVILIATGCSGAAVVSKNISTAADNFEVTRRVVFFNGITDTYLLVIEGRCSINADTLDGQLEVTIQTGPDTYKKHFLGLSDNVSYFVEQIDESKVSKYYYRVMFRPTEIIPNIDIDVKQ